MKPQEEARERLREEISRVRPVFYGAEPQRRFAGNGCGGKNARTDVRASGVGQVIFERAR